MAYFSSYYPDIEATRQDIQSRIHMLEDRLSLRPDLTDDLQRQEIQLNINNLYRLLKDTIESQTQLHGQIAHLRSQVSGDTHYQQRLHSLENTRREAAQRAILLDQQLRDINAERRYLPTVVPPPISPVLPPTYAAERELLEHRLKKEYNDGLVSSEIRRHELLRNSDRLDQLRNAQYSRGVVQATEFRNRQAELLSRTRDYLGSGQKQDRFRETAAGGDNFPLKNEHLIKTSYPERQANDPRDVSRTYDTPFKTLAQNSYSHIKSGSGGGIRKQGQAHADIPQDISDPRGRDRRRERSRSRSRSQDNDDDSEKLLEKYTKGQRAEQIRKELGAIGGGGPLSQDALESNRYDKDRVYHRPPKRINSEEQSASPKKKHKQNFGQREGAHVTFNNNQSLVDKTVDEKAFLMRRSRSRSRSPSDSNIRRSRLKKSASKRRLKHNPEAAAKVKADAIQRIQNRLLQAWALFEDSNFRNVKHEHDHLFNTYAKQEKFRKQIRQKIELQPHVQRRFGLHIEP